jgi:hypothetical protein
VGEKRGKEEKKSFPFSEFVRLRHKLINYFPIFSKNKNKKTNFKIKKNY